MRSRCMLALLVGLLLAFTARTGEPADPLWTDKPSQPFLAVSFQRWYRGLSSTNAEERRKTLQGMLPTQKDIEYLFPKQAAKLWPLLEKVHDSMVTRADSTAKDFTRPGQLVAIEASNVRRDPRKAEGNYRRLLAAVPREVPVYDAFAEGPRSRAGSGVYLYVNEHWIYFPHLPGVVQVLSRLE